MFLRQGSQFFSCTSYIPYRLGSFFPEIYGRIHISLPQSPKVDTRGRSSLNTICTISNTLCHHANMNCIFSSQASVFASENGSYRMSSSNTDLFIPIAISVGWREVCHGTSNKHRNCISCRHTCPGQWGCQPYHRRRIYNRELMAWPRCTGDPSDKIPWNLLASCSRYNIGDHSRRNETWWPVFHCIQCT